jgi:signal transduction histidine kinase
MFIIALAILVIAFILTYRNLNYLSAKFLVGIISGWLISIISLLIYINKRDYYYNLINKFFGINLVSWTTVLSHINIDLIICLLNLGITIFIYSMLGFSIAFTRRRATVRKSYFIYSLSAIVPLIEMLINNPYIFRFLDAWLTPETNTVFIWNIIDKINFVFRIGNVLYLLSAFVVLFSYYFNYPNISFFKKYTLLNILCLLPVVIIYFIIFAWLPKLMLEPTNIKGFYNYILPDLREHILFFNIFPFIVSGFFAFMVVLIFKYNSIEKYYQNYDVFINRSIDTANLSVRTFSHSVKNHLVAIQAEASFLKKRFYDDCEARHSLELILNSCESSLRSLERAKKLKDITLSLKPMRLSVPLESILSHFNLPPNINLELHFHSEVPIAYIDEVYFSEALSNIIQNAIEAIGNQNEGIIEVVLSKKAQWAIISITDNGPGIPDDAIEQIFSPFFSTKAAQTNWGIGLSYCHKIISGHDGKIGVESQLGKGTSFTIMLPAI